MKVMDDETRKINAILKILGELPAPARVRVVEYLKSRMSEDAASGEIPREDFRRTFGGSTRRRVESQDLEGRGCFDLS